MEVGCDEPDLTTRALGHPLKFDDAVIAPMLTVRQAATMLNVHVSTLRRWERAGLLDPARVGPRGDRRYTRAEIEALLTHNGREFASLKSAEEEA